MVFAQWNNKVRAFGNLRNLPRPFMEEVSPWTCSGATEGLNQNPDGVLEAILDRAMTSQRAFEIEKQQSTDSN